MLVDPPRLEHPELEAVRGARLEGNYDFAALGTAVTAKASMGVPLGTSLAGAALKIVLGVAVVAGVVAVAVLHDSQGTVVDVSSTPEVVTLPTPSSSFREPPARLAPPGPDAAIRPPVTTSNTRAKRHEPVAAGTTSASSLAAELSAYEQAMSNLSDARYAVAIGEFDAFRARWPHSRLMPEVELSRFEALTRSGDDHAAAAAAAELLAQPHHKSRKRQICGALREDIAGCREPPEHAERSSP